MNIKKQLTVIVLIMLILCSLTSCGKNKYTVEYDGCKDMFSNAKASYKAGENVILYFTSFDANAGYCFYLDNEPVGFSSHEKHGTVLQFTMPEHDVVLSESSDTDMQPSLGVINPLSSSNLEELTVETGLVLTLPENEFSELSVTRINTIPPIYELDFTYTDGLGYTFRLTKSLEQNDISGMYLNWSLSIIRESADTDCTLCFTGDGQGICLWQDEAFTYSIYAESANETNLLSLQQHIAGALKNE